jgi:hypothetical protein
MTEEIQEETTEKDSSQEKFHFPQHGGATSLEGALEFQNEEKRQQAVDDLIFMFWDVQRNIFADHESDFSEKAVMIENLTQELVTLITEVSNKTFLQRLKEAFTKKSSNKSLPNSGEKEKDLSPNNFSIFRDKEGQLRWVAEVSNNYRDRDYPPEILSKAAHEEFVEFVDSTGEMPELWVWHTPHPTTIVGKADGIFETSGFLYSTGVVDKDKEAIVIKAVDDLGWTGVSHGFNILNYDDKNNVIRKYRTYEISLLPPERAANEWTSFDLIKEKNMSPEKQEKMEELLGPEVLQNILGNAEAKKLVLDGLGIESKEIEEPELEVKQADEEEEEVVDAEEEEKETVFSPEEEAAIVDLMHKALDVEGLQKGFNSVVESVQGLQKEMKNLKVDDRIKVEEALIQEYSKATVPAWGIVAPTESTENVVSRSPQEKEEVDRQEDANSVMNNVWGL